jgi:hypothetical protein
MPVIPPGTNPGILRKFRPSDIEDFMDGKDFPNQGPHTNQPTQFGFKFIRDFEIPEARARFIRGMTGQLLEVRNGKAKIHIQGVTEYWHKGNWVKNIWVDTSNIERGEVWKDSIRDWKVIMNLTGSPINTHMSSAATDTHTSTIGKTIFLLLDAFHTSPAPFMGTKLRDFLVRKKYDIGHITTRIVQGMKDANVYDTFNRRNFSVHDIITSATHKIDNSYNGSSGVYLRYHKSASSIKFWKPDTTYAYVGKSVDFRKRYMGHTFSTTKYGELTRNSSSLTMLALCTMDEQDNVDLSYLVEQIFVCLLQSWREDLNTGSADVQSESPIEHIDAIEATLYFKQISRAVFARTGYPGAIVRPGFQVSYGANYSMPLKEWAKFNESTLFIRHDTCFKNRQNGEIMPMAIFRKVTPKRTHYRYRDNSAMMTVFMKLHEGSLAFSLAHIDKTGDGTTAPLQDDPFHVVFEIRKDGGPHPQAWSRLPDIGGYVFSEQGRSMAVRMEWEHPAKSGMWRSIYLQSPKTMMFMDKTVPGSHVNLSKTISMIQWLSGAAPNHSHSWIPRFRGSAHVFQAEYDYHQQRLTITYQTPITMHSGAMRDIDDIQNDMKKSEYRLLNVGGAFGQFTGGDLLGGGRKLCDTCVILGTRGVKDLQLSCTPLENRPNCCRVCMLFGRPCCSWTSKPFIREPDFFLSSTLAKTSSKHKVTTEDAVRYKVARAALVNQPAWVDKNPGETFQQETYIIGLAELEDEVDEVQAEDENIGDDEVDLEQDD